MRTDNTAGEDAPTAALLRECAAKTVDALLAELRRRPIVQPEWLSLQEAAIYCGCSEQQFSDFVKRGIAPKSVLFSATRGASSLATLTLGARRAARAPMPLWASVAEFRNEHDDALVAARPSRSRCGAVAPESLSQRLGKPSPQSGRHRSGRPCARKRAGRSASTQSGDRKLQGRLFKLY